VKRAAAHQEISVEQARRLLMHGQGLLLDPARRAAPAEVRRTTERMGFVQVDTINVVERAHHHILASRLDGYRPAMLRKLLERDRTLFEHWTHDASIIPTKWFNAWKHRFARYREKGHSPNGWWARRIGGDAEAIIRHVRERIESEGPLMSRDFQHDGPSEAWWGWKPQKAALEYLWRTGELMIARRENFHKVYDLTERVLTEQAAAPAMKEAEVIDWACGAALDRLGVATPAELAAFFRHVTLKESAAWCDEARRCGEIVDVLVHAADGSAPRRAVARPDWRRRAARTPTPPDRMRLLSPFDPVLRDRRRALRLFSFDYRFEAFVPEAKRRFGYYVLPILEGDRFVGRLDPKLHRDFGELRVRRLWWEPAVRVTPRRRRALDDTLGRFAHSLGASTWRVDEIVTAG
jgi:hypothetical protein